MKSIFALCLALGPQRPLGVHKVAPPGWLFSVVCKMLGWFRFGGFG